jgi:hypothetical protein
MKTIPQVYGKNGYAYNLLSRQGNVAIYEQRKGSRLFAYEVVKIRVNKASKFKGVEYPESERLPSDDDRGIYGKTFSCYGSSQAGEVAARMAAEAKMRVWVAEEAQRGLKQAIQP